MRAMIFIVGRPRGQLTPQWEKMSVARVRQTTEEFKQQYALRAGIEGSISQGVHALGLRRCHYIGLDKAHFQHLAKRLP